MCIYVHVHRHLRTTRIFESPLCVFLCSDAGAGLSLCRLLRKKRQQDRGIPHSGHSALRSAYSAIPRLPGAE